VRIGFVTPEFVTEPSYSGGLANYLGRVSAALVGHGHEVHVYTRAEQSGEVDHEGVHVHRVVPLWDRRMILDHVDPLVPRKLYNPYQDLKAARCLSRRVKRDHCGEPFDVVQVANVNAVGLFIKSLPNAPVIVRMSNYRPDWDTAAGYATGAGAKARWKMEEWSVRGRRYLYAPSYYVARRVQEAYRLNRVDVIESPFFPEQPKCDTARHRDTVGDRPFALFFGRMTQMKGVHILAQALGEWMATCPDIDLVLIGNDAMAPGGPSMREYVRMVAGEFAGRVRILESMRHEQLYPFIEAASFVVLPSLIDNLPNTLLESMGHGKVVIGTEGTSFEQLIDDGMSGLLVPPGDVSALAMALIRATQMPAGERERIGNEAKRRIARLHPDEAIPRLIEYFECVRQDYLSSGVRSLQKCPSAS
jgi:glycosyltransferase involved in cell wall biosynthesis